MRKRTWFIILAVVALATVSPACGVGSSEPQLTDTSMLLPSDSPIPTHTSRPSPTEIPATIGFSEPAETPEPADTWEGEEEGRADEDGAEDVDETAPSLSLTWEDQARDIRLDVEAFCEDFSLRIESLSGLGDVDHAYEELNLAFEEINEAQSQIYEARNALYEVQDTLNQARVAAWEEDGQQWEQQAEEDRQQQQAQLEELAKIDGGLSPSDSELSDELREWYRRLPDNSSIEQSRWSRAKFGGVCFAIAGVGESMFQVADTFRDATFNGVPIEGPLRGTTYDNLGFVLREQHDVYELIIYMPENKTLGGPFGGFIEVPVEGVSYGTVAQGDYVFADTSSRQVFVNGELRNPQ